MNGLFNIANVLELAVDHYRDRDYLVCDGQRRTYGQMEDRANQLAHHLQSQGLGHGDHIGIYGLDSIEWVETMWASLKIRAIYANINYRYVADELAYIFDNADLKALVVQRKFLPLVNEVKHTLPKLEYILVIEDGTDPSTADVQFEYTSFESAIEGQSTARDFPPRSELDHWMVYTGGTTGMPKGVVWEHKNWMYSLGGAVVQMTHEVVEHPQEIIERGKDGGMTVFSIAPLMHGATQVSCLSRAFEGDKIVIMGQFDPNEVWRMVEEEKVNSLFIIGDAMARPMIEALEAKKGQIDTSSIFLLSSSGAVFSPAVKDLYFEHFPELLMIDSVGASEVGGNGMSFVKAGETQMSGGGPTFKPGPGTVVIDEETMTLCQPGDGKVGKVARSGYIPLEYYNDPVKSAATFITLADGVRYSIPGDFAQIEADGCVTLLGRGSVSINSGGEKIFPEEVESAAKAHSAIFDCVVVGVPDEKWGSRVALVAMTRGADKPDLAAIQAHCRTKIAGYKIPRELHYVDAIPRSPAGKPNYAWAKSVAMGTA
jgi:acyl-CoA synthetase (AMP-forming)/AMP-acid ligase II